MWRLYIEGFNRRYCMRDSKLIRVLLALQAPFLPVSMFQRHTFTLRPIGSVFTSPCSPPFQDVIGNNVLEPK